MIDKLQCNQLLLQAICKITSSLCFLFVSFITETFTIRREKRERYLLHFVFSTKNIHQLMLSSTDVDMLSLSWLRDSNSVKVNKLVVACIVYKVYRKNEYWLQSLNTMVSKVY